MTRHRLVAEWQVAAPRPQVWDALLGYRSWPTWWRGFRSVEQLAPGEASGVAFTAGKKGIVLDADVPVETVDLGTRRTSTETMIVHVDWEAAREGGRATAIDEKPARPTSNYAVTGLYFYDGRAPQLAATLAPSARGARAGRHANPWAVGGIVRTWSRRPRTDHPNPGETP